MDSWPGRHARVCGGESVAHKSSHPSPRCLVGCALRLRLSFLALALTVLLFTRPSCLSHSPIILLLHSFSFFFLYLVLAPRIPRAWHPPRKPAGEYPRPRQISTAGRQRAVEPRTLSCTARARSATSTSFLTPFARLLYPSLSLESQPSSLSAYVPHNPYPAKGLPVQELFILDLTSPHIPTTHGLRHPFALTPAYICLVRPRSVFLSIAW